jgi:hypothetical protein
MVGKNPVTFAFIDLPKRIESFKRASVSIEVYDTIKNVRTQIGSGFIEYSGLYCTINSGVMCTTDSGVKYTTFEQNFKNKKDFLPGCGAQTTGTFWHIVYNLFRSKVYNGFK